MDRCDAVRGCGFEAKSGVFRQKTLKIGPKTIKNGTFLSAENAFIFLLSYSLCAG
jgi:hypothetical protein